MAFRNRFELVLNETVKTPGAKKGERKEVGKVMVPCPILSDFGINAAQAKDDKGELQYDNGLPVYDDSKFQWLMDAIQDKVSVKSRNKFDKGNLKPGMMLADDFDALTAESARTGAALALRREARADFENYLRSLDKKEAVIAVISDLFWNSSKVLGTASDKSLNAITHYAQRWVGQLSPEKGARFQPKIAELNESIQNATLEVDLMEGETEDSNEQQAA
jgi:hypothetical protein